MTLGEKLRQARVKRGLSQTQVVGDHMTRNMLSQLENDLASPSVKTLVYLADILGVSPGWLLDDASSCDRVAVKKQIKELYARQDYLYINTSCCRKFQGSFQVSVQNKIRRHYIKISVSTVYYIHINHFAYFFIVQR